MLPSPNTQVLTLLHHTLLPPTPHPLNQQHDFHCCYDQRPTRKDLQENLLGSKVEGIRPLRRWRQRRGEQGCCSQASTAGHRQAVQPACEARRPTPRDPFPLARLVLLPKLQHKLGAELHTHSHPVFSLTLCRLTLQVQGGGHSTTLTPTPGHSHLPFCWVLL